MDMERCLTKHAPFVNSHEGEPRQLNFPSQLESANLGDPCAIVHPAFALASICGVKGDGCRRRDNAICRDEYAPRKRGMRRRHTTCAARSIVVSS